jgi:hypothetical protein
MITCYLRYVIDPYKLPEFEKYSRMIMPLAAKYGGTHHGTFLPHEGPNNIAVQLSAFRRWPSTSATAPPSSRTTSRWRRGALPRTRDAS